jgi:hypothetical protein
MGPVVNIERGRRWLYAATMLLSAFLLFAVQPMFGRMVLPPLGGGASVWITVALFFQIALLAGYAYAHTLSTRLSWRRQVAVHAAVSIGALALLPVSVPVGWASSHAGMPQIDLMMLMAGSVGLPFFAVSATAPLLQRWYSLTTARDAGDPYHLYAASNLGSLAALLLYPTLIEPALGLRQQALAWTGGFGALLAALIACTVAARLAVRSGPPMPAEITPHVTLSWNRRLYWIALAAVPSSLFLGLTTQISTDIAAVPLLWILPLAIYLLTFVVAFARRPILSRAAVARAIPYVAAIAVLLQGFETSIGPPQIAIGGIVLFLLALMCHSDLAALRPAPAHLTEFYLLMSLGGALGGAFNGLLAPLIFSGVYEYPIALALALLLWASSRSEAWTLRAAVPKLAGVAGVLIGLHAALGAAAGLGHIQWMLGLKVLAALLCFAARGRPLAMALLATAMLAASTNVTLRPELARYRSFFGVHRIERDDSDSLHFLVHGNTDHGAQFTDPQRRREPLIYYSRTGPAGQALAALRRSAPLDPVGVIGLGAGAMACLGAAGEHWTFFEVDPAIAATARDPRYFTYLAACPVAEIVLGDGRLQVAKAPDGFYRLLVVDAFGSDAIPVHLLTREAMALYFARLQPGGVLLVHFSNRAIDLLPVLAALAADRGLAARWQFYTPGASETGVSTSEWAIFARTEQDLGVLAADSRWVPLPVPDGRRVWTDDYANILSVIRWHR